MSVQNCLPIEFSTQKANVLLLVQYMRSHLTDPVVLRKEVKIPFNGVWMSGKVLPACYSGSSLSLWHKECFQFVKTPSTSHLAAKP